MDNFEAFFLPAKQHEIYRATYRIQKKDVKQSVMPLPWLSGASGASFPRYPCHSCDSAQYFRCSKIEISKQPLRQGLCRAKGLNLEKGANKAQIFGQKGDGDWSFSSQFVAVWMTGYSCTTSVGLGRQTLSSGSCPRSVDQRRWLRTSENRVFHSHHTQFVDSTPWIELRSWGWKEKTCKLTAGTVRNSHVYYDSSDDLWWPDWCWHAYHFAMTVASVFVVGSSSVPSMVAARRLAIIYRWF